MQERTLSTDTNRTATVATVKAAGRHLVTLAIVVVIGVAIALAINVVTSTSSAEVAVPVNAEAARWTAVAAAYEDHDVLTPARMAEAARWTAMAYSYSRGLDAWGARYLGQAAASD